MENRSRYAYCWNQQQESGDTRRMGNYLSVCNGSGDDNNNVMGEGKVLESTTMRLFPVVQVIIFALIGSAIVSHAKTEAALDAKTDVYLSLSIAQLTEVPLI